MYVEAWAAESGDGGKGPLSQRIRDSDNRGMLRASLLRHARSVGHKPSSSHAPGAPGSFTGESICMSVIQRSPGRALDLALPRSVPRSVPRWHSRGLTWIFRSLGRAESGLISFSLGCYLKCGLVQTSLLSPGISYALLSFLAA